MKQGIAKVKKSLSTIPKLEIISPAKGNALAKEIGIKEEEKIHFRDANKSL